LYRPGAAGTTQAKTAIFIKKPVAKMGHYSAIWSHRAGYCSHIGKNLPISLNRLPLAQNVEET